MTDPIKSLELLIETPSDKYRLTDVLHFKNTEAPRLLAIIRRQREALEKIIKFNLDHAQAQYGDFNLIRLKNGRA